MRSELPDVVIAGGRMVISLGVIGVDDQGAAALVYTGVNLHRDMFESREYKRIPNNWEFTIECYSLHFTKGEDFLQSRTDS